MNEQELREIDRRVALALGWSNLRSVDEHAAELGIDEEKNWATWGNMHIHGDWYGWCPDARESFDGEVRENPELEPVPRYTTDPAAADLVRLEIERRGWGWSGGTYRSGDKAYRYAVVPRTATRDTHPRIANGPTPHVALCLAFLAAVEAEKASVTP